MARAYVGVGTLLGVLLMLAVFSGWTWGLFVLGLFMAWVWMPLALIPAARQLAERIRQTLTPETEIWLWWLLNVVHLPTTETLRTGRARRSGRRRKTPGCIWPWP